MKIFLVLALFCPIFCLASFKNISVQPILKSLPDYTTGSSMMFARGYDSFKDDSSGLCVDFSQTQYDSSRTADSIQESVFKLELVESRYDLAKKIGVSAAASLKSGFSKASASVNYLNEQSLSTYSIYVLISAEVLTPIERIVGEDLKPGFIDFARSNPMAFRQKCGNEYVAAIQRGGVLYALLKLDTVDGSSYTQIKTSLRARVGTFKTAVDLERSISEATSNKSLQIFVHQIGGEAKSYPTNVADLLERVKDFSIEVAKKPTPLRSITVPYSQLKSYPIEATEFDTSVQESVLEYLNQLKFRLIEHRDNVNYILNNKSQFVEPNIQELQQRLDYVNSKLNEINLQTKQCLVNFANCKFPDDFKYIEYILPLRLENVTVDNQCKLRVNPVCGYIYKNAKGPECGVSAYKLAANSKCGVKSFKLKASAACEVALYKESAQAPCDVLRFNERKDAAICGSYEVGACALKVPPFLESLFATKNFRQGNNCRSIPNSCRHPSFGVEAYKTCRDKSFGVESYKECRAEEHGVEAYNECRDPEFGVEEYASCEHPSHEVIGLKQCKLQEYLDQESATIKYRTCQE